MHPEHSPTSRIFYPTKEWKRRFVFFALSGTIWLAFDMVVINLFLWVNHHFDPLLDLSLGIGICLAWFLMSLFTLFMFTKPLRHIITSEGITFCSSTYRIYTPWNNIRGIGKGRFGILPPPSTSAAGTSCEGICTRW